MRRRAGTIQPRPWAIACGVVDALGPEREVIEGVLLLLVSEGKLSVASAGEILGLWGRISTIRWYTGHGLLYPDLSDEDLADDLGYASP